MKPTIAITMGDPCGIGPEVIVKGLLNEEIYRLCRPLVIGNFDRIKTAASEFAADLSVEAIPATSEARFKSGILEVLDNKEHRIRSPLPYGRPHPNGAAAAFSAIRHAAQLAIDGAIDGIATAPIHKESMQSIGFPFPGHTEFFADAAAEKRFGMMMLGEGLRIMLTSIHLPLRDAIRQLNKHDLAEKIRLCNSALKKDFGLQNPHFAVAGLNPHAGEGGIFGDEEKNEIIPAIEITRKEGIDVSGPLPADTLFYQLRIGRFDAAIALYHDQALIPIKLLAFGKGINVTIGLSFIRTSVDHGTAYDIAGKGIADPGSLVEAVKLAATIARHRYPHFKKASHHF